VLFAVAVLLFFKFVALTRKNIASVKGARVDLSNW
jgi:hypothetical protein